MTDRPGSDAAALARRWLAVDPDPDTRAETERLLAEGGLTLNQRFTGRLGFGTAGIRGERGAGPMRMNRVLVRSVAAAIGRRLLVDPGTGPSTGPPTVVVGFDARHQSDVFAEDTARVLAGLGVGSLLLPRPLPTPVVAHAVLDRGAAAGIVATASHNPGADSGIKVYWGDGAQIVSPIDVEIESGIDEVGLLDDDLAPPDHPLIVRVGDEVLNRYVQVAADLAARGDQNLLIAHTALHGVGAETLSLALATAGFQPAVGVAEQAEPDPDFPTVPFPNPEEPGALDAVLDLGAAIEADLVLANDPDADRLAVAVPVPAGWRILTGDELGGLLAEHLLAGGDGADRLVVTTIVSSRLLAAVAAHHGVHHAETLTGFKWIVRPALADPSLRFVFGYEEALGYAVGDAVRDKDGITAAVTMAVLAAEARADGRTVVDLLHDLWRRHGVHRTGQRTRRFDGPDGAAVMAGLIERLRTDPPDALADRPVTRVVDYAASATGLPPTHAVAFEIDGARLVVRPSGTEPKLKVYGEVVAPVGDEAPDAVEAVADRDLDTLLDGVLDRLLLEGGERAG